MTYNIAVAGKGGVGKTSLTGLLIDTLVKQKKDPILVVDADANCNLYEVLGSEEPETIGHIREVANMTEKNGDSFPGGMTKAQFLQWQLSMILEEGDGYDMLVMGRSEGEGCYCFVNGILKQQVQKISDHFKYVITDNEAGMEHISRKLTKHVDTLILVSDCAKRSIQAVARIRDLAKEMNLSVGKIGLIVNKAPNGELSNGVKEEIEKYGLDLFGVVPSDELIYEYDSEGIPLVKLPADSKSRVALEKIIETLDLP